MANDTGWKAAQESRRPHSQAKLRRRPPKTRISKKKRNQAKDRNQALRLKDLL